MLDDQIPDDKVKIVIKFRVKKKAALKWSKLILPKQKCQIHALGFSSLNVYAYKTKEKQSF